MTESLRQEPAGTVQRDAPAGPVPGGGYVVSGTVVHGEHRGRELGWPTANVQPVGSTVPPDGVYAATVEIEDAHDGAYLAAVSVGDNPTFPGAARTVEAHLLDYSGDLYGRQLVVRLLHKLRDLEAYDSLEDLITAISADVDRTRALLGASMTELPEGH